jgi:hypothetical protein
MIGLNKDAIKPVLWLHEGQLKLADLRQDLVDTLGPRGPEAAPRLRLFLTSLERASVIGHPMSPGMTASPPAQRSTRSSIRDPATPPARSRERSPRPVRRQRCCSSTASRSPRSPRSDTTINIDANGHTTLSAVVGLPQMLSSQFPSWAS